MEKLTQRQREILDFIKGSLQRYGCPPSIPEVQEHFGFRSPHAVVCHLQALERKGYIRRRKHCSRGIELIGKERTAGRGVEIPIVGEVSAGVPLLAEENIVGTLSIDPVIVRSTQDMFALKVKGDSMIGAGIFDGDYVVVHQQRVAEQGEIVVAIIEDEATVKRFRRHGNKVILQAENDRIKDIVVNLEKASLMIAGKVKAVLRRV